MMNPPVDYMIEIYIMTHSPNGVLHLPKKNLNFTKSYVRQFTYLSLYLTNMTEQEFTILPKGEQFRVLHQSGVAVSERRTVLNRFFLHQLGSFYVEIKYHIEMDYVQSIRSFSSINELDPYLKMINIRGLLKVS